MTRTPANRIVKSLLLAFGIAAGAAGTTAHAGCGGEDAHPATAVSFDVPARHALYGFGRDGSLYHGDFNGARWTSIQTHDLQGINASVSADHRWVLYGGDRNLPYDKLIGNPDAEELWLFDVRAQKSRRILAGPFASMISIKSAFSPDGRQAVTFSNYDDRTPTPSLSGLYRIDLAGGDAKHVGFSAADVGAKTSLFGSVAWSRDGRLFLFYRPDYGDFSYANVDPKTGRATRVQGRYDRKRYEHDYFAGGKKVPLLEERSLPSRYSMTHASSPNGTKQADIDHRFRLVIRSREKHGGTTSGGVIATGRYDDCEGPTIGIVGWIDEDYLVYRNDGVFFVHDANQGRSRPIDFGPVDPMSFFWVSEEAPALSPH